MEDDAKCAIKITSMGKKNPYYRVALHGADGEPLLNREFTVKHVALGMALVVGGELGIDPDLTIHVGNDDTDTDGGDTC